RDINRLAEELKERNFSAEEVILTEGESGVGFFVVGEGTVTDNVDDVGSGGPGDYFGKAALMARKASRRAERRSARPLFPAEGGAPRQVASRAP
ncbi:MAG: cyclic nucleotide-binding domain-containing protein, partial [Verrucomicrobiota bacterium]